MKTILKEYLYELEKCARYTVACTCGAIGCMIELVITIPTWIRDGLVYVAELSVRKYQKEGKYIDIID